MTHGKFDATFPLRLKKKEENAIEKGQMIAEAENESRHKWRVARANDEEQRFSNH